MSVSASGWIEHGLRRVISDTFRAMVCVYVRISYLGVG